MLFYCCRRMDARYLNLSTSLSPNALSKLGYVSVVTLNRITDNGSFLHFPSLRPGFHELVPPELISIFTPKELELLISGLPDVDLDDLQVRTSVVLVALATAAGSTVGWMVLAIVNGSVVRLLPGCVVTVVACIRVNGQPFASHSRNVML